MSLPTSGNPSVPPKHYFVDEAGHLELAEVQALNRQPMYMRGWIAKLDDVLRLSGRDILKHAGKISHEQAARKAELEVEKFHRAQLAEPSQVKKDLGLCTSFPFRVPEHFLAPTDEKFQRIAEKDIGIRWHFSSVGALGESCA